MFHRKSVFVFLSLVVASASAYAASVLWTKTGANNAQLGMGACGGLDFNNDGVNDVLVGESSSNGKVSILSGSGSHAVLWTASGEKKGDIYGLRGTNAGDVNMDGIEDFIVAAPGKNSGTGRLYVYAGGTGALLYTKDGNSLGLDNNDFFGRYSISKSPGDFNGDGYADFAVAADGYNSNQGKVFIWSGQNGSLLASPVGTTSNGRFGYQVSMADVNGDGYSDLLVSEYLANSAKGMVHVFMGPTGVEASYSPIQGEAASDQFGTGLDSAGHFSTANHDDIVIGAPFHDSNSLTNNGRIYVYDGLTGALIASSDGAASATYLGYYAQRASDFNQDGFDDVMTVNRLTEASVILSGPALAQIWSHDPGISSYGMFSCSVGDTNLDSFPEVMVAAPYYSNDKGQISINSFVP